MLLQVQGMVAEYERAKILERSRRGKLHAAHRGMVNVLSGAPYGYRYVNCQEGAGEARYEIVFEEARIVRQIHEWVGRDRLSIGEVCRRLQAQGVRSAREQLLGSRLGVGCVEEPRLQRHSRLWEDTDSRTELSLASAARPGRATQTRVLGA
jgi:hypothetical protein